MKGEISRPIGEKPAVVVEPTDHERMAVIICTKDRHADLQRFLATLQRQTAYPERLIVVDASTAGDIVPLLVWLAKAIPTEVKHIRTKPNIMAQRKIGLEQSECDIVCYFDDDVLLENDCIHEIKEGFRRHPDIGALTGRQLNVKDKRFHSLRSMLERPLRYLFFVSYDNGDGRFRLSGEGVRVFADEHAHEVEVLSGCFMCYRRRALAAVDIDINHPFWSDDVMISYQSALNNQHLYWPRARLTHNHSLTGRMTDTFQKYRQVIFAKYYQRHTVLQRGLVRDTAFRISLVGHLLICLSHLDFHGMAGSLTGRREARQNGLFR